MEEMRSTLVRSAGQDDFAKYMWPRYLVVIDADYQTLKENISASFKDDSAPRRLTRYGAKQNNNPTRPDILRAITMFR